MKNLPTKEELISSIYKYVINDDKLFENCCVSLNIKSTVSEDPNFLPNGQKPKFWNFIGFGCGITWLEFPKRSFLAKLFDNCYREAIAKIRESLINNFDNKTKEYYKSIGCPLEAIFYQDQNIQLEIYRRVAKYAIDKLGFKKCEVESRLD